MQNGDVWAIGSNEEGQLGIGNTSRKHIPIKIENDKDGNKLPAIERIVEVDGKIYYIAYNGDKYLNGVKNTDEIDLEQDTITVLQTLKKEQLERTRGRSITTPP
jgi:alpha-tubulin suppressor-like RCC1 family protein